MTPSVWNSKRRLVPRWRSLRTTIQAKELVSVDSKLGVESESGITEDFRHRLEQWRHRRDLVSAGELVEAALVTGSEFEAKAAARYLLSQDSSATIPLRHLAGLALKRAGAIEDIPAGIEVLPNVEKAVWRRRVRQFPQNALAWVELALLDTVEGKREQARRAIAIALQLAPENRHVLRSAARFYLHTGDPERAYLLLAKNSRTPFDPWLIAAELSIAELANRKPRFFRHGLQIIGAKDLYPRQITELTGAMGTLELVGGKRKRARDLFAQSMRDPTGNALAQAEWASPQFAIDIVSQNNLLVTHEADEARAFHLQREDKLQDALAACNNWAESEPYSVRPFELSSAIHAQLGDYEACLIDAQKGLLMRPSAPLLLNNRAFALANLGRLSEAEAVINRISSDDQIQHHVTLANRGLIAMRRGQYEIGTRNYRDAIGWFRRNGSSRLAAVAQMYFAREAALANLAEANELYKLAKSEFDRQKITGHSFLMNQTDLLIKTSPEPASNQSLTTLPPSG